MIKTYRYRIYPSKRQGQILNDQLALCCELYNAGLQERIGAWQSARKSISYIDQQNQVPEIKGFRPELKDVNATVLLDALRRLDKGFQSFFRRLKRGERPGFPRFRSVRRYNSLTIREVGSAITGNKLRLSKIGIVRIKLHRPFEEPVKALTVKREAGRWLALFSVECKPRPLPESARCIGVDVGITAFATFSDGSAIENPRYYERTQKRLRIAARKVARRKRRSRRRDRAIRILQRVHAHVRNQRSDFHHKLSRAVVNNFGLIAVENLNVKGLARMNLAKQVHDAGWSSFIDKLTYKAESAGRLLIKVNPSGTSQTCICGARVEKTLSQRWHECSACGLSAPRDHVSAQIILGRGLRLHASTVPLEAVA